MTEEGVEEAVRQIESSSWKDDQVLVVYLPGVSRKYRRNYCGEDQRALLSSRPFVLTKGEDRE